MTTRILIFGREGQVARELGRGRWPRAVTVRHLGRRDLDLSAASPGQVQAAVNAAAPALVINAAAYTAVDAAESDRAAAFALNARAPELIARACAQSGCPLIHISTDYVFDGQSPAPYKETDPVHPVSVYGASKLAGEEAVRAALPAHVILRTAWVYSPFGHNFVKTMLRLGSERERVSIVDDQRGTPTAAEDIAGAIVHIAAHLTDPRGAPFGTYHYTAAGETTWYGFACEIFALAARAGRPVPKEVMPIATSAYPTAAARPANSVLDCTRIEKAFRLSRRPWREGLTSCLAALLGPETP